MEDPRFKSFRYGLAVLFMRHPNLRPYAPSAHWWIDEIADYGDAVRFRDKLRAAGGNKVLLEEYERRCRELEIEMQSYFFAGNDRS
ncbi:hypothetical protein [Rhizobium sp. YTU87027]|uniref:hypothetical protein n=1 Tax=Rhizobium sp. YTU87027 TaxID=3417741 RepID=UPI003D68CDC7